MKLFITGLILTLGMSFSHSQEIDGTEFGIDGTFYASSNGGSVGFGGKYGLNFGEYIILGPSVRYQRSWFKNNTTGTKGGYNVFGGGAFAHARFFNALFAGIEFEMLNSPYTSYGYLSSDKNWTPTLLMGGGFSMEFNEMWRLNVGAMYDVINHANSPLRTQYFMRNSNNTLIPLIYRISFFFPLT